MKNKFLYLIVFVLGFGIVYFLRSPLRSADFSSTKVAKNETAPAPTSTSKALPGGSVAAFPSVTSPALPEIKFEKKDAFEVADPPFSREALLSQFVKGRFVDGIAMKVSYEKIYDHFKKGNTFEVPTIDGRGVYVIPRKVVVNPDGVSIFIGEAENEEKTPEAAAMNEANFMFLKDRFIGGQLRIRGKVFTMENGSGADFMLEMDPNAKID